MPPLSLRAALTRAALVVAANWQAVLVDFVIESFYKLALTVPIIGGALMVATLVGTDLAAVLDSGVIAMADIVIGSLSAVPVALLSFLCALSVVAFGGAAMMFALKAGTLSVVITGERAAGDVQDGPLDVESLKPAAAYSLQAVVDGVKRFRRRAVTLAVWLGAVYFCVGTASLAVVTFGFSYAAESRWAPVWPLLVLVTTLTVVVVIAIVHVVFDLLRVIVVVDDCGTRVAAGRLRRFIVADARQVIGIFAAMSAVLVLATGTSFLAASGLALVAYQPIVGLVIVPLQAVAWILRGLVFQYTSLVALTAYGTQYRRWRA